MWFEPMKTEISLWDSKNEGKLEEFSEKIEDCESAKTISVYLGNWVWEDNIRDQSTEMRKMNLNLKLNVQ